jgi:hypothetical protein
MAEIDVPHFESVARAVYRERFKQILPRNVLDALGAAFYFGPAPDYSNEEAPSLSIESDDYLRLWLNERFNEYGYNPTLVGPPVPEGGVQASDAGDVSANLEAGLEERSGGAPKKDTAAGLPAWAWGAIAAGLVLAGWSLAGKGRRVA